MNKESIYEMGIRDGIHGDQAIDGGALQSAIAIGTPANWGWWGNTSILVDEWTHVAPNLRRK
eukprot:SAG11_NODE_13399_length_657_cov_1.046595_1_plen_62_part_00